MLKNLKMTLDFTLTMTLNLHQQGQVHFFKTEHTYFIADWEQKNIMKLNDSIVTAQ